MSESMLVSRTKDEILANSNELLKKAMSVASQSEEIATEILTELNVQREKIVNVQETMVSINQKQFEARKYIGMMGGFWNYVIQIVSQIPIIGPVLTNNRLVHLVQEVESEEKVALPEIPTEIDVEIPPLDIPILQLSDASTPEQAMKHDENEQLLLKLCGSIDRLGSMAKKMGDELDSQVRLLGGVNSNVEITTSNMHVLKKGVDKI